VVLEGEAVMHVAGGVVLLVVEEVEVVLDGVLIVEELSVVVVEVGELEIVVTVLLRELEDKTLEVDAELVLLVFEEGDKEKYAIAAIATNTIRMTTGMTRLIPRFLNFTLASAQTD
jgi:hypothetical protein